MSSKLNPAKTESYDCPNCPRGGFKTPAAVRSHFMAKHRDRHCTICNADFPAESFVVHCMMQHVNSGQGSRPPKEFTVKAAAAAELKPPQATVAVERAVAEHPALKRQVVQHQLPERPPPRQDRSKSQVIQRQLPERPATKRSGQDPSKKATQARQERPMPPVANPSSLASSSPASKMVAVIDEIGTDPDQTQSIHRHVILHIQEQNLVFQELWIRCHTPGLLVAEGYKLGPSYVVSKTHDKKAQLKETNERKAQSKKTNEKKAPRPPPVIPVTSFLATPKQLPNRSQKQRRAVVLDCEMVLVEGGYYELAYLTAVDFLTNEILINNYVQPTRRVWNWNTKYSGISCAEMNRARAEGRALRGWQHARQVLWEYVDSDTVLIGHALHNDLKVLGFYHFKIVDSQILTAEAVTILFPPDQTLTRRWGLKGLTKVLLEDDIQAGKKGHSALEDTRATRDVVIWCIRNTEPLKVWAEKARDEEVRRILEEKRKNEERRKKQEEEANRKLEAAKSQLQTSTT